MTCAHPVDEEWRTDTAERPALRDPTSAPSSRPVVVPPPTLGPPQEPRFPLYADQVGHPGRLPSGPPPSGPPTYVPDPGPDAGPDAGPGPWVQDGPGHRGDAPGGPGRLPWVLGAAALVLTALLGGVLLLDAGDDQQAADPATPPAATPATSVSGATTAPSPSAAEPTQDAGAATEPTDVARLALAAVPATAPPNQDVDGNLVRYEARNMLDGVASTCWRRDGDGTGDTITLTLDAPTTLTSVGMINGYAKTSTEGDTALDWYRGNRRVLAVEWGFDDGTTVAQTLREVRDLQSIDLDPVTTTKITLRLVSVSAPGTGRSARNYTAISDLALVGTPS